MDSKFKDPKTAATAVLSVIAGVLAYCFLIAPAFADTPYWDTASQQFMDKGIGYSIIALALGAIWLTAIFFSKKKEAK
ncbi:MULTISPECIES: hypothetical protein [unclassified Corynebacterium]|uniref:hypothetical protein n=1 Tax=unclassified Corynebacterium TaxID=2624378 RepID=UPI0029CA6CC8|nr:MULTISPECIES: hypothetical protein [unclassified Corynebacterium]WPF66040.1 hypothetical protein OLX12_10900 [Corynebacterium sp. 22KM0430]WPF68533.1 hypothetical protein OLW90_10895 [Corynebacterium sp. 21KM1197]